MNKKRYTITSIRRTSVLAETEEIARKNFKKNHKYNDKIIYCDEKKTK